MKWQKPKVVQIRRSPVSTQLLKVTDAEGLPEMEIDYCSISKIRELQSEKSTRKLTNAQSSSFSVHFDNEDEG